MCDYFINKSENSIDKVLWCHLQMLVDLSLLTFEWSCIVFSVANNNCKLENEQSLACFFFIFVVIMRHLEWDLD